MSHTLYLSKLGISTDQSGDVSLKDAAGSSLGGVDCSMKQFLADTDNVGPKDGYVNIPGASIAVYTDNWAYSWYGYGNRGKIRVKVNEPSNAATEIKLYNSSYSLLKTISNGRHGKYYYFTGLNGGEYYYVEVKNVKNAAARVEPDIYLGETSSGYNTSSQSVSYLTLKPIIGSTITETGVPIKYGAWATVSFRFTGEKHRFDEIKNQSENYEWSWDSGKDTHYGIVTSSSYATIYNGYSSYAGYTGSSYRKNKIYAKFVDGFNRTHLAGENYTTTIPILLSGPDVCGFKWKSTGEDPSYNLYASPQYNYLNNGKFTVRGIPGVNPRATSFEFKIYTKSGSLKDTIVPSGYSWASTSSDYNSGTYKIKCTDTSSGLGLSQSQSAWVSVGSNSGTRVKRPKIRAKYVS